MKTAVILLNLGGPDSLDAIEPFLYNLFCDKDIFKLPFGQKNFAKFISKRRAPKVMNQYELLGGKSPINKWTETQRTMLESSLRDSDENIDVFVGMRYWKPFISDVVSSVKGKYDKIILLPLYPHYSITTTGSSFNEWKRNYTGNNVVYINDYCTNKNYINAINKRIDETILRFPEDVKNDIVILFSAHGTPVSLVKKGDPYSKQITATVDAVMKARNYSHNHYLCFQSKVGPVKWLEPSTDQQIIEMANQNKNNLLIVPISFVSDHVETLYELDIEYRHVAEKNKIGNYIMMQGLNDSELFIDALKNIVIENLN
ncbi:MAG: ferrochelatase [Melioribacteraceae bacterium]|nr:ferrochelatase [Melioribacteraceae bacterium]